MPLHKVLPLLFFTALASSSPKPSLPIIIHTWSGPFTTAADTAFLTLRKPHASVLDAVQVGGSACERNQCDGTVGYGGSPSESCETTLDAMIMDGNTMNVGAVGAIRRVKHAIAVARHVLEYTDHTMLVGDFATQFAVENGFKQENLTTEASAQMCESWKRERCQPNSRVGVVPDPRSSCGPYMPLKRRSDPMQGNGYSAKRRGHDTISLIALDASGNMAAGTTTNGQAHKIPGRVGDGPIAGSGSYVDSDVGGCGATGDGDIMMRFLPCYQAVESMRRGMSPLEAAEDAVKRMVEKVPGVHAGVVVMNAKGEHAAAASNWQFSYSFRAGNMDKAQVVLIDPIAEQKRTSSEL
ncbi:hypothetical protein QQS21_011034 [Conoideocrella luteorostrata]|uniref:Uncharacterized protein n=1 Tax=Conoideocrella luteorostrata TaxID=1105319 RepID=A0AAJ0FNX4_9HYPO|nr:hypothetical protein QQS21_011034 [Conoideocrella luteorostrata]